MNIFFSIAFLSLVCAQNDTSVSLFSHHQTSAEFHVA